MEKTYLNVLLTDKADSNNSNAVGDYSTTGVADFTLAPAKGEFIDLKSLVIFIQDTSAVDHSADKYGDLAALTVGIDVLIKQEDGTETSILSAKIKSNLELVKESNIAQTLATIFDSGADFLACKIDFEENLGEVIELAYLDELIVRVNDDTTGLTVHNFMAKGFKRS